MAHEYAEALDDIADLLDMPTGATPTKIVKAARKEWANGIHTCHDQCPRAMCALRRERDAFRDALKRIVHNPGWQDPEVGFMSGHIAAGALNQFPENSK